MRATAFTHVIRRGGRLYIQYWLYYPDSNSVLAGSDRLWERSWILPRVRELVAGTPDYPGFHRDDWEGVFVRIDPDGSTWVRASSHGRFQGCKWRICRNEWTRPIGLGARHARQPLGARAVPDGAAARQARTSAESRATSHRPARPSADGGCRSSRAGT